MQQRYTLLLACMLLGMKASVVQAQIAGTSIFLQGQYVEIGINECGVYGSDEPTPVGPYGEYHKIDYIGIGYIADHEKDGWDVATGADQPVFCGDYSTPGWPEEGWAIQYGAHVYANHNMQCYDYGIGGSGDISGSNLYYKDLLGTKKGIWAGSLIAGILNLSIKQITSLEDTALFYTSVVEITNNGLSDLTDLYYMRDLDPDQDFNHCGTFFTTNRVISNSPSNDTVLIEAIGDSCGCYLGTIAVDSRARVSFHKYGITFANPSEAYEGFGSYGTEGEVNCDCTVQVTWKFNLPAGESTTLAHARFFDKDELTEAAQAAQSAIVVPVESVDNLLPGYNVKIYPNPATASFQIELHPYMSGVITVEVSTTSGQVVWTEQANSNSILNVDSSTWSNGVYYVRVSNTQASYVNTVVIDK